VDPLIVHIQRRRGTCFAQVTARRIVAKAGRENNDGKAFWPGPLTLAASPRSKTVPVRMLTAGRDLVGSENATTRRGAQL